MGIGKRPEKFRYGGNFPHWKKKSLPLHGSFRTAAPVLYAGIYLPLFYFLSVCHDSLLSQLLLECTVYGCANTTKLQRLTLSHPNVLPCWIVDTSKALNLCIVHGETWRNVESSSLHSNNNYINVDFAVENPRKLKEKPHKNWPRSEEVTTAIEKNPGKDPPAIFAAEIP